jgi:hypothetical protein
VSPTPRARALCSKRSSPRKRVRPCMSPWQASQSDSMIERRPLQTRDERFSLSPQTWRLCA